MLIPLSGCPIDAKVTTQFDKELVAVKDNQVKLLDSINVLSRQQTSSFNNVKKAVVNNGDSDLLRVTRYITLAIVSIILLLQFFKLLRYQYPKKEKKNVRVSSDWAI